MTNRFAEGLIPPAGPDQDAEREVRAQWEALRTQYVALFEQFQFHTALERLFTFVRSINAYVEKRAPWKLGKSSEASDRVLLATSLATITEALRVASVALRPVMPAATEKINAVLGYAPSGAWTDGQMLPGLRPHRDPRSRPRSSSSRDRSRRRKRHRDPPSPRPPRQTPRPRPSACFCRNAAMRRPPPASASWSASQSGSTASTLWRSSSPSSRPANAISTPNGRWRDGPSPAQSRCWLSRLRERAGSRPVSVLSRILSRKRFRSGSRTSPLAGLISSPHSPSQTMPRPASPLKRPPSSFPAGRWPGGAGRRPPSPTWWSRGPRTSRRWQPRSCGPIPSSRPSIFIPLSFPPNGQNPPPRSRRWGRRGAIRSPSRRRWSASPGATLKSVVLARAKDVRASDRFHPLRILNGLRQRFPDCTAFSVANGKGQSFIGASPERLIRVEDGVVLTEALAGSAGRGGTASEDAALGNSLIHSEKDTREHRIVLDWIVGRLAPFGLKVRHADRPSLKRLSNVQHLHTPVEADLPAGVRLLDLLSVLHPTPAVGGMPGERALPLIGELEGFPRGLYGGALGWIDSAGAGEFVVGLCARPWSMAPGRLGSTPGRASSPARPRKGSLRKPSSSSGRCRTRSLRREAMKPPALDSRNVNALWGSVVAETLVRSGVARAVVSPGSRSTPLALPSRGTRDCRRCPSSTRGRRPFLRSVWRRGTCARWRFSAPAGRPARITTRR